MIFIDILIDYLTFSSKNHLPYHIKEILGLKSVEFQPIVGRNGWSDGEYIEGIRIYYGGKRDDVGVELSGVGCRAVESFNDMSYNWTGLLTDIVNHKGEMNVSRLDVACDDKDGILPPVKKLARYTDQDKFVSRARHKLMITGSEEEVKFGSPKSSTRLRIYNKALERGVEGHWVRSELQMRDKSADSFILNLMSHNLDIGATYSGVLLNYLRYTTKKNDGNHRDRLPTADWWDKFLGTSERIKNVTIGGLEYNLMGLEHYLRKQCASSIKTYIEACGGDLTRFFEMIDSAEMNDKQKSLLDKLKNEYEGDEYGNE